MLDSASLSLLDTEPFIFESEPCTECIPCECRCELLLCVVVKLACCTCMLLGKLVCPVCRVGGGGVGMRVDLSLAELTSLAFLDAGSESVEDAAVLLLVVVGSGR